MPNPLYGEMAVFFGPQCDDQPCEEQAACVRMRSNPPTGLDENGRIRTKNEWLADLWDFSERGTASTVNFVRDQFLVLCHGHYFKRTPPRETTSATGPLKERGENARARIRRFRVEAIAAYGGQCSRCERTDIADLRLKLDPSRPLDYWSGMHLNNWAEKYEHLAERGWPEGLCIVLCIEHEGELLQAKRTRDKQSLRSQIVEGYGRVCVGCTEPVNTNTVWLVRKPGQPALTYQEGRKMNTRAKYETLVRLGFPAGWSLICPGCYSRGIRQ